MADIKSRVSGFFSGIKKAAGEVLETQEIALIRGKTVSKAIFSDEGELLVDAGHRIDDDVINHVRKNGKMSALVASAVTSQAQDIRERARSVYQATPDGVEAHALASSEQYIEARQYIGRLSSMDVTDIRGNVIIGAGQKIDDEHVRAARESDQLGSLIYSAQQSPAPFPVAAPPPPAGTVMPTPTNESKRAARPLSSYYEEDEKE